MNTITKTILLLLLNLTCLITSTHSVAAEKLRVMVPPDENPQLEHIQYFYTLLDLALAKTLVSDGDYEIVLYPQLIPYERNLHAVKVGIVDVFWANTDKKRNEELLPIRISLLKDLNDYRIFFIRTEDQGIFNKIKTLNELRELTAGQGSNWPDTTILRNNEFRVVTSMRQDSLLKMLASKRFDFYPRGLYEIWREEAANTDKNIAIEKNLMIYYDSPVYFFVTKTNKALADRIERGLRIAISDGSFDRLFFSIANFKRGYEEQINGKRKIFKLEAILDQPNKLYTRH